MTIPTWETPFRNPLDQQLAEFVSRDEFRSHSTIFQHVSAIHQQFPSISAYRIAKVFQVRQNRIDIQLAHIARGPVPNGRPPILTAAHLDRIDEMVKAGARDRLPLRVTDVVHYLAENEDLDMNYDTLRKALKRTGRWQMLKLSPIDHDRQMVTDDEIAAYKQRLKQLIDGQPASFVFNCDESGFDSWCDARKVSCLIPVDADPKDWSFPVKRNEKRITLLGCISASGDSLNPLCITGRKTIDDEVFRAGYTPDRVAYSYSATGYITEAIFTEWVRHILIPHIEHLRVRTGMYEQQAFLIMDNCTAHRSDELESLFFEHGIVVIPLIPHSSHKTQQLDIGIFGNVKQAQSRIHPSSTLSTQSQQLLRMLGAWVQITHPMGVTSAFRRSGVHVVWRDGGLRCYVSDEPVASVRVDVTGGIWPEWDCGSVFQISPVPSDEDSDSTPLGLGTGSSASESAPDTLSGEPSFDWDTSDSSGADFEPSLVDRLYEEAEEVDSETDSDWEESREAEPVVTRGRPRAERPEPMTWQWNWDAAPRPRPPPFPGPGWYGAGDREDQLQGGDAL